MFRQTKIFDLFKNMSTVKLGWGFAKPIARKTNERFQSLRYSLHAAGGWLCMQHPGPRNGAAILEVFPSSGNIAAPFLGPRKNKQELLDGPDGRGKAGAMDTHIHIILWGDMAQKLFWISEKGPLSRAARSHANLLRSGNVPPLQRLCQEAVLSVRRALVAVHPVRALWDIL